MTERVPVLDVLRPGPMTTVQDLGRPAFQHLGVPVSGAVDTESLRLANALVGNGGGTAALEVRLAGPILRAEAVRVHIAVAGPARLSITRAASPDEAEEVAPWRSHVLERGDVLSVGALDGAAVAYVAVEGGFDLPPVLGSRSTYVRAALGGMAGRPLAAGDRLPLAVDEAKGAGGMVLPEVPDDTPEAAIRVIPGPQDDYFPAATWDTFLSGRYVVGREADRMGLRLEGPTLAHDPAKGADIVSDGLATGAIQVPGNGQPIILLADRQTVGGYPKIATVASVDLPRLGRLVPGTPVRFAAIEVAAAQDLLRAREAWLRDLIAGVAPGVPAGGIDLRRLYEVNLVGGMVNALDPRLPEASPDS